MRYTMTTKRDLRNWVDTMTANWDDRTDAQLDTITDAIQAMDRPAWGTDWSEFLSGIDELSVLLETPTDDEPELVLIGKQVQHDSKKVLTRVSPTTGIRLHLIHDRKGNPIWVSVPKN